jgi:hypothetical protein
VGAADHDLGALGGLADLDDVRLEPGAVLVALVGDLLGLGQQGLDLAQVEQGVAVVGLLDDAGDDVALAPGVLLVLHVALDLADALEDDLLGRLRGDAAEVVRRVVPLADDLAVLVELLAVDADLTRVGVDGDDRLLGRVGTALVGRHQGVGQGVEQRLDGDPLVAGDLPSASRNSKLVLLMTCSPSHSLRLGTPLKNGAGPLDLVVGDAQRAIGQVGPTRVNPVSSAPPACR